MKTKTDFFSKLLFFFKKTPVVVIIGERKKEVQKKTTKILGHYFQIGKDLLIFTANNENIKELRFFLKYSRKPILVATQMKAIRRQIQKTIQSLTYKTDLIINCDDSISKRVEKEAGFKAKKFGLSEEADLKALNNKKVLKVDYKGSIVPIHLSKENKENIYVALATIGIGTSLKLNLVKISQVFKKE